jgi:hypothetical protein
VKARLGERTTSKTLVSRISAVSEHSEMMNSAA